MPFVLSGSDDLIALDTWDLGMDYSMGGLAVGFAADSNNDWGLSASMAAGGFAVDAEFGATGNEGAEDVQTFLFRLGQCIGIAVGVLVIAAVK